MKLPIKKTLLSLSAACLFTLLLVGLLTMREFGRASAQITPESVPCPTCRFGIVGITRGQTIRLNVVNTADVPPGPCRTISSDVPPGPCSQRVDLLFMDSMGRTVARSSETLTAGRAAFLDFDGSSIERQGIRLELRPLVLAPPPDPDRSIRSFVVASVEVFNSETGKTLFFVPSASDPSDFSLAVTSTSTSAPSPPGGISLSTPQ